MVYFFKNNKLCSKKLIMIYQIQLYLVEEIILNLKKKPFLIEESFNLKCGVAP